MKDNFENFLSSTFSFFILLAIFGGGLVFILFVLALILGGQTGTNLAVSASTTIMPYFIKSAGISIIAGLLWIYSKKAHILTLEKPSRKN